jgi:hypothetical protein
MKLLFKLISKETEINGETHFIQPKGGWRRRVFDSLMKKRFDKTYKDTPRRKINELTEFLNDYESIFRQKKLIFIVNIQKTNWLQLQVTHPVSMYDITKDDKYKRFGYIVHWVFDPTSADEEEFAQMDRFKRIATYNDFFHSKFEDEIDTFSFDCEENTAKVTEIVSEILTEVFKDDPETRYLFTIMENGTLE